MRFSTSSTIVFTWRAAVLAAAIVALPLVVRSAQAAFEGIDPSLEAAARTLGRSEPAVFFTITLPLAWRGVLAGTVLGYARAMGEFGAVYVVSGHIAGKTDTMPLRIEKLFQEYNLPGSFAVASVLTLLAILTLIAQPPGWAIGYGLAGLLNVNMAGELMRTRLFVEDATYVLASAIVIAAAMASALVVRQRVNRLDLVAVLKTRD